MPTHIGIGFSQATDLGLATKEASLQAKNQVHTATTDLVILFTTIHYAQQEILPIVEQYLQPARLIGCSTAGHILSDRIADRGIGILAISSDEIHFGVGATEDIGNKDLREIGFQLARSVTEDFRQQSRQAFIFFADGLFKNNSMFVRGAQEVLGNGFPIIGAVSSDDFSFKKTFQYHQRHIMSNAAAGLLMGSQMSIVLGNKHGWRPLGKPRTITQAEGHIIKTIDNQPAAKIYEEYLGQSVKNLRKSTVGPIAILYPLGIYIEEEHEYLLRNAVDITDDGSIVCQGEVPPGSEVHIMIGNKDSCREAALAAATEVREGLFGRQAKLLLIFESMTRHKILGRNSFQEIQIIKDVLGYTTPMIGMYSGAEISPFRSLQNIRNTHLQNESMVILAIG